ncbi:hypothetical protein M2322_004850 [Rhodoblastus acidophilus]|uniref:hypothetical protein n=1 Tax=Rhodoblastus acidophilus TaxID=1074 RepID=UPI00222565B7|nr:hypothetical protein [Rhodoblastus acidophilus]MCW2319281.1 hypothetical protein [Rhodoblastus acidophilus]
MEPQAGTQPSPYNWSLPSDWTRALTISALAAFEKQCEALREYSEIMAGWAARREEGLRDGVDAVQAIFTSDSLEWKRIAQRWASGSLRRTVEDISAMADLMALLRRT